jgi:hypothetical protein
MMGSNEPPKRMYIKYTHNPGVWPPVVFSNVKPKVFLPSQHNIIAKQIPCC